MKHRDPMPVLSAEEVEAATALRDRQKYERRRDDVMIKLRLDAPMPDFFKDDEHEWEQRWQNIKWMAQALAEPGRGISPAVRAAIAEFDADIEAYWRAHPELDDELAPEPEAEPDDEPESEPVSVALGRSAPEPEPVLDGSGFVASVAAAMRGALALEVDTESVAELEMSRVGD